MIGEARCRSRKGETQGRCTEHLRGECSTASYTVHQGEGRRGGCPARLPVSQEVQVSKRVGHKQQGEGKWFSQAPSGLSHQGPLTRREERPVGERKCRLAEELEEAHGIMAADPPQQPGPANASATHCPFPNSCQSQSTLHWTQQPQVPPRETTLGGDG